MRPIHVTGGPLPVRRQPRTVQHSFLTSTESPVFGEIAGKRSCAARGGAGHGAPLQMECQTAQLQSAAIPLLPQRVAGTGKSIETARLTLGFGRLVPPLLYRRSIKRMFVVRLKSPLCDSAPPGNLFAAITVRNRSNCGADPLDRQPQRIQSARCAYTMCSLTLAVAQKPVAGRQPGVLAKLWRRSWILQFSFAPTVHNRPRRLSHPRTITSGV